MTSKKELEALIRKQYEELTRPGRYPELGLSQDFQGRFIIHGDLHFRATCEGYLIKDNFEIRIEIPRDYPKSTPDVFEPKNRTANYHHSANDKLCLAEPVEEWLTFSKNPTLLYFVTELIIPFLYRFCYCERHEGQEAPWGELPHGSIGLIEHYKKHFRVTDKTQILKLLKHLVDREKKKDHKIRGHFDCPCGSGKIIRNCHANELRTLEKVPPKVIRKVIYYILCGQSAEYLKEIIDNVISRDFCIELEREFSDMKNVKRV